MAEALPCKRVYCIGDSNGKYPDATAAAPTLLSTYMGRREQFGLDSRAEYHEVFPLGMCSTTTGYTATVALPTVQAIQRGKKEPALTIWTFPTAADTLEVTRNGERVQRASLKRSLFAAEKILDFCATNNNRTMLIGNYPLEREGAEYDGASVSSETLREYDGAVRKLAETYGDGALYLNSRDLFAKYCGAQVNGPERPSGLFIEEDDIHLSRRAQAALFFGSLPDVRACIALPSNTAEQEALVLAGVAPDFSDMHDVYLREFSAAQVPLAK
ncbi:MAG TPA: hypothetical protein VIM53_02555 [Candidatus Saccharimonadales bacterium]